MIRRMVAAVVAVMITAAAVIGVRGLLPSASAQLAVKTLPPRGAAAVTICPGPETQDVPAGAQSEIPPGPVMINAVVAAIGAPPPAQPAQSQPMGSLTAMIPGSLTGQPIGGSRLHDGVMLINTRRTTRGPLRLATPTGAVIPAVSAVQSTLGTSGDLRGLSAAACASASTQVWLVGGGSTVGRRGRLLVANPAATPAVIDVIVYGPRGARSPAAGTGVALAPGAQTAFLLDALAPGLTAAAVQVHARSGRIVAVLQDSSIRGVVPGGVDDVTAAAPPARRQIVTGIDVRPAAGMTLPDDPGRPGAVAVRVVAPSQDDAVVRVHLIGKNGTVNLPGGGVSAVPAGAVRDIVVTGVAAGLYAAVVDSDVPVLAGALIGRAVPGGQLAGTPAAVAAVVPPSEFGWAASAQPLSGPAVLAIPATGGLRASLALTAADAQASVQLTEIAADGTRAAQRTVVVTGGSTLEAPLAPTTAAVLLIPGSSGTAACAALVVQSESTIAPALSIVSVRAGAVGAGPAPVLLEDPWLGLSR